jgi:hypothetical protein
MTEGPRNRALDERKQIELQTLNRFLVSSIFLARCTALFPVYIQLRPLQIWNVVATHHF